MNTFDFSAHDLFELNEQPRFVVLGKRLDELDTNALDVLRRKVNWKLISKPDGVWGTLGWADNKPFSLNGSLAFSTEGNLRSHGVTADVVQDVRAYLGLDEDDPIRVKERFINLSAVDFGFDRSEFSLDDLPNLRLTLFVEQEEGALVFYQYNKQGEHDDKEAAIEYILPQSTDRNYSNQRDRLSYHFPIIPPKLAECDESGNSCYVDESRDTDFIVKILTYKREDLHPADFLTTATININRKVEKTFLADVRDRHLKIITGQRVKNAVYERLGRNKYGLLVYNRQDHDFDEPMNGVTINPDLKTLLLLHGTFVSTKNSYGPLYGHEDCLLDCLIDQGKFEQIIAFDHPSVSHDVVQNAEKLYDYLAGIRFSQPVSLIGTSRGALLAKWLSADKGNRSFEVDKMLTFSGAFGVGFFTAGKYVGKGLSALRFLVAPPAGTYIAALSQYSANFILEMPGFQDMTPKHKRHQNIIDTDHRSAATKVQCVSADWHPQLSFGWRKPFSRMLDFGLKAILGRQHDWVVGFNNQGSAQRGGGAPIEIQSVHVKNFDLNYSRTNVPYANTHEIIETFFG